jgi:hypothetical protein
LLACFAESREGGVSPGVFLTSLIVKARPASHHSPHD